MSERGAVGAVLCAGFGTRLRPLTETIPKPLLPFLNTPIVTYALSHLAQAGIEDVALNLYHLADTVPPVTNLLGEQFGLRLAYSREWEILGTAGGVRGMWQALGEPQKTLVVLNGDSVLNLDLAAHLAEHQASGRRATLVVRPKADEQPGRVWLDANGRLSGLRDIRRPDAPSDLTEYDFTGVHLIEPELLAEIPLEMGCMVGDIYIPMLERGEEINVSIMDGFWAALDTPELFFETTRRVLAEPEIFAQAPFPEPLKRPPTPKAHAAAQSASSQPTDDETTVHGPADPESSTGEPANSDSNKITAPKPATFVYKPDQIHPDTSLTPPILTGLYVSAETGCKIGPNAVIDGTELAPGTAVENAIIYGMGRIEGDWRNCIAVAGQVVHLKDP